MVRFFNNIFYVILARAKPSVLNSHLIIGFHHITFKTYTILSHHKIPHYNKSPPQSLYTTRTGHIHTISGLVMSRKFIITYIVVKTNTTVLCIK